MLKIVTILILLSVSNAIINRNNLRRYRENLIPSKDIVRITHSQASLISKSWLENILIESTSQNENKDKIPSKLFELQDAHIVSGINQLENYINYHRSEKDIYLSWMPLSTKPKNIKNKTSLFLIVAELDNINKKIIIKQLVQSPLWNHSQIPSYKLRRST